MRNALFPRQPVPSLKVDVTGSADQYDLSRERIERFGLIVFYRGFHCPICRNQLRDIEAHLPELDRRGVSVIAISSDTVDRAERSKADWLLAHLRVGYGLPLSLAQDWGLYISAGRGRTSLGVEEPALFSEPGLFLVRPDLSLYFSSVQTMPFTRPATADMIKAIDYVEANNYPARGEIFTPV